MSFEGDNQALFALAESLGGVLQKKKLMLATAESCTGGWIAQVITSVAGSSCWFERGFVTYTNISKQEMLGVKQGTLELHGAVSEETIREMVTGALRHSHAQVALAVSGIAGPGGGTLEKPVGTVWLAWAGIDQPVVARKFRFSGQRQEIRLQAVVAALQGTFELLGYPGPVS